MRVGNEFVITGLLMNLLACSSGSKNTDSSADSASGAAPSADTGIEDNVWTDPCPVDEREQRMIDVGDVSLNVACRGDGPTVLFLHGFPEFHYSWNAVMDELVADYRLVAPDQRGYNTSDKPEQLEAYELPHLTQDIVNLIPLISDEPVIVVAHDWGGPVGWSVAHHPDAKIKGFVAANGPHPQRFADLLATDPDQQEASAYMDWFRSSAAESFLTPEALASDFGFAEFLSEEELAIYTEAWSQPGAITGGLNWYRANDLNPDTVRAYMAELSPTIPVPVSVLWGLDDTAVLPQNAEGLEGYAPDLTVETFAGVDHWIEHRIPAEVARAVREVDSRSTK